MNYVKDQMRERERQSCKKKGENNTHNKTQIKNAQKTTISPQ